MTWRPASSHHKNTKSESAPVWLWLWLWLSCACGCGCGSRVPVAVAVTLWLCGPGSRVSVAVAVAPVWLWLWLPGTCRSGCGSCVAVAVAAMCLCLRLCGQNTYQLCAAGGWSAQRPSEPALPCRRSDNFLQKVRSRLRKTTTFRHRPSQGEPLKTELWPAWNQREQHGQNRIMPPVQVKRLPILCCWKLEGPRALRTGAPVYAKRQLSPKGTLSST